MFFKTKENLKRQKEIVNERLDREKSFPSSKRIEKSRMQRRHEEQTVEILGMFNIRKVEILGY